MRGLLMSFFVRTVVRVFAVASSVVVPDVDRCRTGLAGVNGKCEPGRSSPDGTPCTISAECTQGSFCGPQRTCTKAGAGEAGSSCSSDASCKSGLRCNIVGFGAQCQPE